MMLHLLVGLLECSMTVCSGTSFDSLRLPRDLYWYQWPVFFPMAIHVSTSTKIHLKWDNHGRGHRHSADFSPCFTLTHNHEGGPSENSISEAVACDYNKQ